MIFTLAFYILEGTVSTTIWTTKKVYNWWYQVPPEPTLHEIKEELESVMNELKQLKNEIREFYYNKKFISACSYCKGRDYGFGEIDAAIQTKKPLTFQKTI